MPVKPDEEWTGLFPDPRLTSKDVRLLCLVLGHAWMGGCNNRGKPIARCGRCWRIVYLNRLGLRP